MQHSLLRILPGCNIGASLISILEVIITVFVAVVIAGVVAVASGFTVFAFVAFFDAFVIDVFFSQQCIILAIFYRT